MALITVPAPSTDLFRLARGPEPFALPAWGHAHSDGTFGNRFDDPSADAGVPPAKRFRMVYCTTHRIAAFAETLARFRVSLNLLAGLAAIDDDETVEESLSGAIDAADPRRGLVQADWRIRRRLGVTTLAPTPPFVDIFAPGSMRFLRHELAGTAARLGIAEIDVSSLTSQQRAFTQQCARRIYELKDSAGRPRYSGIRYLSRHNPAWECWACSTSISTMRLGARDSLRASIRTTAISLKSARCSTSPSRRSQAASPTCGRDRRPVTGLRRGWPPPAGRRE